MDEGTETSPNKKTGMINRIDSDRHEAWIYEVHRITTRIGC